MSHTPGPWRVEDHINVYADGSCICTAYGQAPEFAAYEMDAEEDPEARANALLMAGSPDLLNAAIWASNALADWLGDPGSQDAEFSLTRIRVMLEDAITKAGGRA